jgi:hypothetical protein
MNYLSPCFAATIFISASASATGLPSGVVAIVSAAESYVSSEVRCFGSVASVAIRTRDSIEHLSFSPIRVPADGGEAAVPISCNQGHYELNGVTLSNLELTGYALAASDEFRKARQADQ